MTLAHISTVPTAAELQSYKIIAEVASSNQQWRKIGGGGSNESIVATILSVMLLARELGISPIQAISGGINNIQGRFEISARLMNQLIRKHGHKLAIKMNTDQICMIWTQRKDTGETHEEKYTIEEAARSGLVKPGSAWQKTPTDMLFARCISRLARRVYPDCLGGCYVEGELQESISGHSMSPEDMKDVAAVKNEFDIHVEPVILLNLPDSVDENEVNIFIEENAKNSKIGIEGVKKKALANMEGFLQAFQSWRAKNIPMQLSSSPEEELLAMEG